MKRVPEQEVVEAVSKWFGTSADGIKQKGKRDNRARQVTLYLLRTHTDMSNEDIAAQFGIGYTAVAQAVSRLREAIVSDRKLQATVRALEADLLCEE